MRDIYNGKLYFTCDMCGDSFQISKYLHRIEFNELDAEDFRPWSCTGVQVCYSCMKKVEEFVFGKEEQEKLLKNPPSDTWNKYRELERDGYIDAFTKILDLLKSNNKDGVDKGGNE